MTVDSNARNTLWGRQVTDAKGRELEGIISDCELNVANRNLSDLPFVPKKTSFLDLTLMGD